MSVQSFEKSWKAAIDASSEGHISGFEFGNLRKSHECEIEILKDALRDQKAEASEIISELVEGIELMTEMQKEFEILKSELGKIQSGYYVGLSVGIITEMFREFENAELLDFDFQELVKKEFAQ